MLQYGHSHSLTGNSGRATLKIEEAGRILGISRAAAYQAAAKGELPVIKIGKRLLVPRVALERMLDAQLSKETS